MWKSDVRNFHQCKSGHVSSAGAAAVEKDTYELFLTPMLVDVVDVDADAGAHSLFDLEYMVKKRSSIMEQGDGEEEECQNLYSYWSTRSLLL